ncbi:hypothetical protein H5J24_19315 [Chryseobacterium capnotolerans]|uniref:hypothetical protein n=1 Tax=Chryseobacterium TaxID=59732 RepID=UPI00083AA174|nr:MULTISPECIES: hypothetical protein [Chryseobacterium]UHO37755.1 hypothetical protein H5J24_19315 [Chryseobacterium capnotolerans]
MEDKEIINLGKSIFGVFFVLGSIFLLGAIITKEGGFAGAGYMLVYFGVPVNILCVLSFLIYGIIYRSKFLACLKAVGILLINIPIATLYGAIGNCLFN